jgi:hypothetical protein
VWAYWGLEYWNLATDVHTLLGFNFLSEVEKAHVIVGFDCQSGSDVPDKDIGAYKLRPERKFGVSGSFAQEINGGTT